MYSFWSRYLCWVAIVLGLTGCVSSLRPSSQTHAVVDGVPEEDIDVTYLADAVVERVTVTNAGNKSPYTVLGQTYHINHQIEGFEETGYASWYGKKFHGRKTSNGETYDMFAMTAAHKTLAIPTYVRVTNLENQRTAVVRVNDRGPFHDGRIIDLSYAAAKKLDYHKNGTAKVKIEVLTYEDETKVPDTLAAEPVTSRPAATLPAPSAPSVRTYLQAGAFSKQASAMQLQRRLYTIAGISVEIYEAPNDRLYKVLIGPIEDDIQLLELRQKLLDAKVADAHVVEL